MLSRTRDMLKTPEKRKRYFALIATVLIVMGAVFFPWRALYLRIFASSPLIRGNIALAGAQIVPESLICLLGGDPMMPIPVDQTVSQTGEIAFSANAPQAGEYEFSLEIIHGEAKLVAGFVVRRMCPWDDNRVTVAFDTQNGRVTAEGTYMWTDENGKRHTRRAGENAYLRILLPDAP